MKIKNIAHVIAIAAMATSLKAVTMVDEIKASKILVINFKESIALFLDKNNDMRIAEHANNFEDIVHRISTIRNRLIELFRETQHRKYYMMVKIVESLYKHATKFHDLFADRPRFFISFIRSLRKITEDFTSMSTQNLLERRLENLQDVLNEEELKELDELIEIMSSIQHLIPENKWKLIQIIRAVWNR